MTFAPSIGQHCWLQHAGLDAARPKRRLSAAPFLEFDVLCWFGLSAGDIAAVAERFCHDRRAGTTRMWLYERRIAIPGPCRLADFAREPFNATEASMAATIESSIGNGRRHGAS